MKNELIETWLHPLRVQFTQENDGITLQCGLWFNEDNIDMQVAYSSTRKYGKFELLEDIKQQFIKAINNIIDEEC